MTRDWSQIAAQFAALVQAADWPRAEALLTGVAGHEDAPPQLQYNLAKVLIKLGKFDQAGRWLERSVEGDPTYPPTWFELGRWHMGRRRYTQAAAAFESAGALMPSDPDCRRLRGRAALAAGDWEQAATAYRELRALIPGDEEGLIRGFRAASEARLPEADELTAQIRARPDLRGPMINVITRVSAGRLPLRPLATQC